MSKVKQNEVTRIACTSKLTAPVGKGWYSFSCEKERSLSGYTDEEALLVQDKLFEEVNTEVDKQLAMAVAAEAPAKPKA